MSSYLEENELLCRECFVMENDRKQCLVGIGGSGVLAHIFFNLRSGKEAYSANTKSIGFLGNEKPS